MHPELSQKSSHTPPRCGYSHADPHVRLALRLSDFRKSDGYDVMAIKTVNLPFFLHLSTAVPRKFRVSHRDRRRQPVIAHS